jgi:hypothetical protein
MAEHSLIRWLIFLIVVALVIGNKRIKPRKPPTHPLPVTGPVETSRISRGEKKDRVIASPRQDPDGSAALTFVIPTGA